MTVTSFNVPDLPFAEAAARQQQQAETAVSAFQQAGSEAAPAQLVAGETAAAPVKVPRERTFFPQKRQRPLTETVIGRGTNKADVEALLAQNLG